MATKHRTYKNSNHKWTYIWIALTCFCSPQHVYELAHGIAEAHRDDHKIMHKLKAHGIIRRESGSSHRHHHHHTDK